MVILINHISTHKAYSQNYKKRQIHRYKYSYLKYEKNENKVSIPFKEEKSPRKSREKK